MCVCGWVFRGRTPYFVAIQTFPSLAVKINPDADSTEGRIFGRTKTGLDAVQGVGEEKRQIEERNKVQEGCLCGWLFVVCVCLLRFVLDFMRMKLSEEVMVGMNSIAGGTRVEGCC